MDGEEMGRRGSVCDQGECVLKKFAHFFSMAGGNTASSLYKGVVKDKRGSWKSYIVINTSFPLEIRARYKAKLNLPVSSTEEEAAHKRDVALNIIFRGQPGGSPYPLQVPHLMTAEVIAGLSDITLEDKINQWREEGEVFATGAAGLKGVFFDKSKKYWTAHKTHPATGKQIRFLRLKETEPNAAVECAKAYDRMQFRWWGSHAKTNYPAATYVNDEDPRVSAAANAKVQGSILEGEFDLSLRNKSIKNHAAAATSGPGEASTSAAAAPAPSSGLSAPLRSTAIAQGSSHAANTREMPALMEAIPAPTAGAPTQLGEPLAGHPGQPVDDFRGCDTDSEYDYESDYESEYCTDDEFDDGTGAASLNLAGFDLLSPEEEEETMEWLKEQGIEFPFGEDSDEELPDDPHGVFDHLKGPNWHIPPSHPDARKLWRAEIARALENFEEDVWKIHEQLEAQKGTNPEKLKINGVYPELYRRWLTRNKYIDAEGNTLRNIPCYEQWLKEGRGGMERVRAELREATAAALAEQAAHPDKVVEQFIPPLPPHPYFSATTEPGLEKMYMPRGKMALMDVNEYNFRLTYVEAERRELKWQTTDDFMGVDGQLSLEYLREAYQDLGEKFSEIVDELYDRDEFKDWFIVNIGALRRLCNEPQLHLLSHLPDPEIPPPTAAIHNGPVDGTPEDWAELGRMTALLEHKLAGGKTTMLAMEAAAMAAAGIGAAAVLGQGGQEVIGSMPSVPVALEPQPAPIPAGNGNPPQSDIQALIRQKLRGLSPALMASAAAAAAAMEAAQAPPRPSPQLEVGAGPSSEQCVVPMDIDGGALPQLWENINHVPVPVPGAGSSAASAFMPAPWNVNYLGGGGVPTGGATTGSDYDGIPAVDDPEFPIAGEQDLLTRWDAVAPGLGALVVQAKNGVGSWEPVDEILEERKAQMAAEVQSALAKSGVLEKRIDAKLDEKQRLQRCDEWNWKVELAVAQKDRAWLTEILGESWQEMVASHPDGKVFGDHRRPPDLHDPLLLQGVYDVELNGGISETMAYEHAVGTAMVYSGGGGGDLFFDSVWRYWNPVLNSKAGCRVPVPTLQHVDPRKTEPVPVEMNEDDKDFVKDLIDRVERAAKRGRRQKNVYYL